MENLKKRLEGKYEVSTQEVLKTNGVKKQALRIHNLEVDQHGVDVLFYVDSLEFSEEQIEDMLEFIKENEEKHKKTFSYILDINNVREHIKAKVVNKEWNKDMLDEKVYIDFLDLVILFYVEVDMDSTEDGEERGTITVSNGMFNHWKITKENLLDIAKENMKKEVQLNVFSKLVKNMFIFTNKNNTYGAGQIILKDMFKALSELTNTRDIYIIPSSVHELILIPLAEEDKDMLNYEETKETIRSVNKTLKKEEVLSENLYIYDAGIDEVRIV